MRRASSVLQRHTTRNRDHANQAQKSTVHPVDDWAAIEVVLAAVRAAFQARAGAGARAVVE